MIARGCSGMPNQMLQGRSLTDTGSSARPHPSDASWKADLLYRMKDFVSSIDHVKLQVAVSLRLRVHACCACAFVTRVRVKCVCMRGVCVRVHVRVRVCVRA